MVTEINGNIFNTKCQTIVNTVNCVGVMGTGIAYEHRLRYPEMFLKYKAICDAKNLNIGNLWIYKEKEKWILNFPTKYHWKYDSKPEFLEKGLLKFINTYKEKGITSIAFPLLGAHNGGISKTESLEIMKKHLNQCDIPIEIYHYDSNATDDLFPLLKKIWNTTSEKLLVQKTNIRLNLIREIKLKIERNEINNLSSLIKLKGFGEKSLENIFQFIINFEDNNQASLFDSE
ncbi:macro domain-containing protein [Tenacibaculum finnmarkense genomovar ulcerans]|nr:macro domain-containing protein [Tenacibaculum finnmarkense genomovar ulcerans]